MDEEDGNPKGTKTFPMVQADLKLEEMPSSYPSYYNRAFIAASNERRFLIRSAVEEDFEQYAELLTQCIGGCLPYYCMVREYSFSPNLVWQREGSPYHIYRVSETTEGLGSEKLLGFLHLDHNATFASYDQCVRWKSDYTSKRYRLLAELGILKQKDEKKGFEESNLCRIGNRGLARLLPVLDPDLNMGMKVLCIHMGHELLCAFAKGSQRLPPERNPQLSALESTLPYQVVVVCYPNDPLVEAFRSAGFDEKSRDIFSVGEAKRILFARKVYLEDASEGGWSPGGWNPFR